MKKKLLIVMLSVFTILTVGFYSCSKNDDEVEEECTNCQEVVLDDIFEDLSVCNFSSPVGYCTAGVRLDKGGEVKGKNVCNGVSWSGNAKDWYVNAQNKGYSVGTSPEIGAIVVWPKNNSSSVGHVGVVTKVDNNGKWWYKAMNDYPNGFNKWSERLISQYPNRKKPVSPTGYIYNW